MFLRFHGIATGDGTDIMPHSYQASDVPTVKVGETVEVSDAAGERLARDFSTASLEGKPAFTVVKTKAG